MSLSIFNARLLDPASGLDEIGGILIEDGFITAISPGATGAVGNANEVIDAGGLCLAPGLIDLRVKTGRRCGRCDQSRRHAGHQASRG